jgi:hypothetical protein
MSCETSNEGTEYDFEPGRIGSNYPGANFFFEGSGTLARVHALFKNYKGETVLDLDSETGGFVINAATSGAWDFDLAEIAGSVTGALVAGTLDYEIETITDTGAVDAPCFGKLIFRKRITS